MSSIDFRSTSGHLWASKWVPLGSLMHLLGALGTIVMTLGGKKRVQKETKYDFVRIMKIAIFLCVFDVF